MFFFLKKKKVLQSNVHPKSSKLLVWASTKLFERDPFTVVWLDGGIISLLKFDFYSCLNIGTTGEWSWSWFPNMGDFEILLKYIEYTYHNNACIWDDNPLSIDFWNGMFAFGG